MKTADSENPDRYTTVLVAFRVFGTEAENTSRSMDGLDVEKKSGHRRSVFFLTPFIELLRTFPPKPIAGGAQRDYRFTLIGSGGA
jgi:hypothetical protein